jgi:hypothetical protein
MVGSSELPATGFLRIAQIVGDKTAAPHKLPIIPVARGTWWAWVAKGKAPKPVKLGPRTTAWRVEDIRAFIERGGM